MRDVAAALRDAGVESVAVCLLHAYVDPKHEQRVGAILAEELPGIPISLSSEVAPEFREYLRASTTVINAAIRPVVARYLENIERRLAGAGVAAELLVMQSSGGVFGSGRRREARLHGRVRPRGRGHRLGEPRRSPRPPDIISFDMGGTTAKVGLIQRGTVGDEGLQRRLARVGRVGGQSLSGYPVRTPVIDLVEIGAGGGSIAWVDSGGMLRVRPRNAGATRGRSATAAAAQADRDRRERRARPLNPSVLPRRRDRARRRGRDARSTSAAPGLGWTSSRRRTGSSRSRTRRW